MEILTLTFNKKEIMTPITSFETPTFSRECSPEALPKRGYSPRALELLSLGNLDPEGCRTGQFTPSPWEKTAKTNKFPFRVKRSPTGAELSLIASAVIFTLGLYLKFKHFR